MERQNHGKSYDDLEKGKEKGTGRRQETISKFELSFQTTVDL